jgi:hypothetical protein
MGAWTVAGLCLFVLDVVVGLSSGVAWIIFAGAIAMMFHIGWLLRRSKVQK